MRLLSAAQMRHIDRVTIEERGIPGIELMERAGMAIAQAAMDYAEPGPAIILCGRGNNGGDGFVVARHLARAGYRTIVIPVLGTDELQGDAATAFKKLADSGAEVVALPSREQLAEWLRNCDVIIDAMLGTGAKGPLRDPMDWIVPLVNVARVPVIAADLPTGLDADTGTGDVVIRAACTVTIGRPKIGMVTANGVRHCGTVRVEPIQFPVELLDDPAITTETVTMAEAARLLPARPIDGHKGTFGLVSIFAGSRDYPGAAVLAGLGALRSGAGLVRMTMPDDIRQAVFAHLPECIYSDGSPRGGGCLRLSSDLMSDALDRCTSAIAGPGLGTFNDAARSIKLLLTEWSGPLLLDADALNILAEHPRWRLHLGDRAVLTPHPGELARLLNTTAAEIQRDRWATARHAAAEFNCCVLLKGFGTLIATPCGRVRHIPTGNTALARGGSGDVLAGVIGGLMAQGLTLADAAVLGAFVCGMAADSIVRTQSSRGVITREIANALPVAWKELEVLA